VVGGRDFVLGEGGGGLGWLEALVAGDGEADLAGGLGFGVVEAGAWVVVLLDEGLVGGFLH
jgi:hypothetical protein